MFAGLFFFALLPKMTQNHGKNRQFFGENWADFWLFSSIRTHKSSRPVVVRNFYPFAAEIARFGKRHSTHHRLRRGELRTVIQMGVNVCRGGKIRMSQPLLNLLERHAVGKQDCN